MTNRGLLTTLGLRARQLLFPVTLSALAGLAVFPAAGLIQRAVRKASEGASIRVVASIAVYAVVIQLAGSVLTSLARYLLLRRLKGGIRELRRRLLRLELDRPLSEVRAQDPSQLGTLLLNDVEQVDMLADQSFGSAIPAAATLVAAEAYLLRTDPLLSAVVLVVGVPALLAGRFAQRATYGASKSYWAAFRAIHSRALRLRRAQEAIVEAGAEGRAADAEDRGLDGLRANSLRLGWVTSLAVQVQGVVVTIGAAVVLVVGAARHGGTSDGKLLAVLYALAVAQGAGRLLANSSLFVAAGRVGLAHVNAALATARTATGGVTVDRIETIELREIRVRFGDSGAEDVLSGIDLTIKAGDRLAVIGPNGAGKSTLLRVVAGSLAPSAGQVLVNGVPIEEVDIRQYRRRLVFAGQRPTHVSGTCEENLRLFGAAQPRERLEEVLSLVGLDTPLDQELGDEAMRLSGGQLQRLSLARVLLSEPDVVLLDEPGNHLDEPVADMLTRLFPVWPSAAWVIVSHDRRVLDLPDVRLVEVGV